MVAEGRKAATSQRLFLMNGGFDGSIQRSAFGSKRSNHRRGLVGVDYSPATGMLALEVTLNFGVNQEEKRMGEVSLNQKAYEATPEFNAYWAAYEQWEGAHYLYRVFSSDENRSVLIAAQERMMGLLEKARSTPEHMAAFGW
jgi:hypothetical protein